MHPLDFWRNNIFQYLPPAFIKRIQLEKIKKFLRHAYTNTPFWHDYFQKINFGSWDFHSWADFEKFPTVTKEQLRKSGLSYWINDGGAEKTMRDITSGSTGIPFPFYFASPSFAKRRSVYLRNISWTGFRENMQIVRIMTRNISGFSNMGRFVQCRGLTELGEKKNYIYRLLNGKITILEGVASFLFCLANLMKNDGAHFDIRAVITTAEQLEKSEIKFMESIFLCPVFNCYGAREVDRIAQECDRREGLHVNADWLYLEIVDDAGRPLPPDTSGKIAVTTFENFATPLIRYDLGDRGTLLSHQCSCGRTLPLLRFEGRTSEYVILPNGDKIHAFEFTGLFNHLAGSILQYQIVQESPEDIAVLIIPTKEFTYEDEEKIKSGLLSKTKNLMKIRARQVDRVLMLPSGKKPVLINKILNAPNEQQ